MGERRATHRTIPSLSTETTPVNPVSEDLNISRALANALRVSTDELLGVKATKAVREEVNAEERRLGKKFQQVGDLPERDQRAVLRLINSLAGAR